MTHKLLQIVLLIFGVVACLVYPLALVWPSGWTWHHGSPASSHYFMMIVGVYATLGVFLIRAAANPAANRCLIWFAVGQASFTGQSWECSRSPARTYRPPAGRCPGAAARRNCARGTQLGR
jgi:hypothetical protein